MPLTDRSRLILLLEAFVDTSKSACCREGAGRKIARLFPPLRRTELYANVLRHAGLSDRVRWVVMLMLYYVGDDHAVEGFTAFFRDPEMPDELKFDAALFAISLDPHVRFRADSHTPRFPLGWLLNGLQKVPPLSVEERQAFVLDRLRIDLFTERKPS